MDDNALFGAAVIVIFNTLILLGVKSSLNEQLEKIAHDIQQVKTAQRASQKREKAMAKGIGIKWEK